MDPYGMVGFEESQNDMYEDYLEEMIEEDLAELYGDSYIEDTSYLEEMIKNDLTEIERQLCIEEFVELNTMGL